MKRAIGLVFLVPLAVWAGAPNYLDTIPVFWRTLYPDGGTGLYCGERFRGGDRNYNIEHVFPMGWVTRELRCGDRQRCRRTSPRFNTIESDLHNMYPARKDLNRARGAFAFSELAGERHVEPGCDMEIDYRRRLVEPRPEVRGDIARSMLYMAERYDLELFERQRRLMLEWHRADPVDADERRRHRSIVEHQGYRNPWIEGR